MTKIIDLLRAGYRLESYFAKEYTEIYISEFHAEFGSWESRALGCRTRFAKYFSSGRYKELNDPELENLYKKYKKQKIILGAFFLGLIIWLSYWDS